MQKTFSRELQSPRSTETSILVMSLGSNLISPNEHNADNKEDRVGVRPLFEAQAHVMCTGRFKIDLDYGGGNTSHKQVAHVGVPCAIGPELGAYLGWV